MRWSEETSESAPTIKNHSVTHFKNYLYCFGGYDGRRNHTTLLIYSLTERRFVRPNDSYSENSVMVQGTPPPGRNGHSATLAVDPDDEENARIIIIGGWLGSGPLAASDMHVLDVSAGGRQLRWYKPPHRGVGPGPCNMHTADYIPHLRSVYVFRGGNGREYLNDMHALDVETLTWRRVDTTGAIPQQRANHSSAMLEETDELFIFGGWNGGERLNDIHILDTTTSNWTCPRVGGILPHPRAGMTLTALKGRLYLFGGSGTSAKCFQDLQILDRQQMAWLDVTQRDGLGASSNVGLGSSHHHANIQAMSSFDHDDNIFRFGGSNIYDSRSANNDESPVQVGYGDDSDSRQPAIYPQQHEDSSQAPTNNRFSSASSTRSDWQSRELAVRSRSPGSSSGFHANPNDEDTVPTVMVHGRGPGRRAGHTATAVNRKIYIFGGSCGSDYLNDFFVLDTDPPPQTIVSEPTSLQLVERRLRHFFNDEEFSDVTFLVEGQRVYGHKMVLSLVSDCFRAMFTTGFRESEAMEIEIPDCSHAAFLSVMEYIYMGSLPLMDLNLDPDRSLGRVVEMLELADRFFLDHLKQICETMLQPTVNTDTVEYLHGVAQKANANQLHAICEHFMRNRERST